MFSDEMMKFLMNYKKDEFDDEKSSKSYIYAKKETRSNNYGLAYVPVKSKD